MPKLSDSMADAVILRWLKSPGEAFERGEGLIEVETDKATVVYEAESDGHARLDPRSRRRDRGRRRADRDACERRRPGSRDERPRAPVSRSRRARRPLSIAAAPTSGDGAGARRPNATPVARRTAVELGVSLHGRRRHRAGRPDHRRRRDAGGRPTAARPPAARARGRREGRGHVARADADAGDDRAPDGRVGDHDPGLHRLDRHRRVADRRVAARGARAGRGRVRRSTTSSSRRLRQRCASFPRFNASYVDGKVECYSRVNVGIAVATDDALLVPVVLDADRKSLAEIAAETRRLADAARRRALEPDDLHDGTFTVSNLGMFGVALVHRDHRSAAGRDPRRRRRPARAGRGRPRPHRLPRPA